MAVSDTVSNLRTDAPKFAPSCVGAATAQSTGHGDQAASHPRHPGVAYPDHSRIKAVVEAAARAAAARSTDADGNGDDLAFQGRLSAGAPEFAPKGTLTAAPLEKEKTT